MAEGPAAEPPGAAAKPQGAAAEPRAEGDGRAQHAQCRFPARWLWLKAALAPASAEIAEQPCPRFDEWKASIAADGVSLVFADAYLHNPSSMYGHTFLRLHRAAAKEGEDLLDYTINFAATPDTENGVLYALKGLVGAFPGQFSTMPYYMKIQEYSNVDFRDLWEYRLPWGPDKVDRLLRHAWEMGSTWFDYYFFSENCSYQLLTLLEGADPDMRLSERFSTGVIPVDTLRAVLAETGAAAPTRGSAAPTRGSAAPTRYRPSHVTEMRLRRGRLTRPELALATRLGRGEPPGTLPGLAATSPERQALILDSAHDYFRYRVGFDTELSTEPRRVERRLLLSRNALGLPSPELGAAPRPASPEAGHRTMRAAAGAGASSLGPFADVRLRAALHDLADDASGYVPDHELEMLDATLRLDGKRREAYFETVDLVRLVSLSPWDPWVHKPSWFFATGLDQAREAGCAGWDCAYYHLRGGAGLSAVTRALRRETWFALAAADAGTGPALERGWRMGGGVVGGVRVEAGRPSPGSGPPSPGSGPPSPGSGPRWRWLLEAGILRYPWGPPREWLKAAQAVSLGRSLDLRIEASRRVPVNEASASLLFYF